MKVTDHELGGEINAEMKDSFSKLDEIEGTLKNMIFQREKMLQHQDFILEVKACIYSFHLS